MTSPSGTGQRLFVRSNAEDLCAEYLYKQKTLVSGPPCCDVVGRGDVCALPREMKIASDVHLHPNLYVHDPK